MPFFTGLLSGILLTVLAVFLVDNLAADRTPGAEPRKIVNWDVAAEKPGASLASLQEQVREDVPPSHALTDLPSPRRGGVKLVLFSGRMADLIPALQSSITLRVPRPSEGRSHEAFVKAG